MRILVTGNKGVVGEKLVTELNARGHSVFGIDLLHHPGETGYIQKMSHENWTYSRCDIGEYRQIERIFNEAGTVVTRKKLIQSPQDLRNHRCDQPVYMPAGGWHYTSMGGKERIRTKFASFAETDYNQSSIMSDENLDACLSTGKDLTDRTESWAQKRFISDDEITHPQVLEWAQKYPDFIKR